MRVEFMAVGDDHTWSTAVVTVPDFLTSPTAANHGVLETWANENLPSKDIACYYVYSIPPDEDDTEYILLDVDEGDESVTLPDFICPKCKTLFGGVATNHRTSILDNGWCLRCEVEKAPDMHYKVWVHVEEVCEALDHYQDVDLAHGALAYFYSKPPAVALVALLQQAAELIRAPDEEKR